MTIKTRGRPRKELDVALLEAASAEFLERGYTDANIERIAAAGNTTKPALYRRYPSKKALFEATLIHLAKDFELDLGFLDPARSAEDVLYELGQLFYETLGTSKVLSVTRLSAFISAHFPESILAFRAEVMKGFMDTLIAYFQSLEDQGVVHMPNTFDAAIIFTTLAGRAHERLMGVVMPAENVEPYLRELVRFFLAGYPPRS